MRVSGMIKELVKAVSNRKAGSRVRRDKYARPFAPHAHEGDACPCKSEPVRKERS